jgi:hypothetical protein
VFNYFGNHISFVFFPFTVPLTASFSGDFGDTCTGWPY